MSTTHCPYCNRPVVDVSRLDAHYAHTSCGGINKKIRKDIALESLSDNGLNPQQENVAIHSMPQDVSSSKRELGSIDEVLINEDIAVHMHRHRSPCEQEPLEFIDEALMNNDLPDEEMGDIEVE
ncbi:hypothetical protein V565_223810, partial [Rhizoctonia solani 123E]